MGGGAVATLSSGEGIAHLIDTSRPWWKNKRILALNGWIVLLLITSATNGYDGSMMNGLQTLAQWRAAFNNPSGGKLGLLNAIQNIGSLSAYPFSPYVTDGFGRRTAVLLGATIMVVATVIQTASQSVGMFIGARFLIGFGLTFAAAAAPLLVTEIAYPTQRGPLTSMYNTMWFLGSIIAAWTTYGTFRVPNSWSWRIPSAIQGLPSVLQIFLVWFAPESPRWLFSKGKELQAKRTLAYYHANGDMNDSLVAYEFEEIRAAIELDREVSSRVGWISLLKTPGNRRRMRIIVAIAFFSQWSGNGMISYYLTKVLNDIGITDTNTQLLINGGLNIWNFLWAIFAGLLCDRIGRRVLFITSTIGMTIFWSLQTVTLALYTKTHNEAAGHTFIAMIFIFYAFYDIAFTPLIVSYSVEILPYSIRAKGFTVFNFAVSLSIIFNQYINPIAFGKLDWKYYIVYCCWLAFESAFVYLYVIETKNRTLEETAALFDGDDTVAQLTHKAAEEAEVAEIAAEASAEEKRSSSAIELENKV